MVVNNTQRVCGSCVARMEKMGLFIERKSSFDKALHAVLAFCEKNKKDFEKWKKRKEKN